MSNCSIQLYGSGETIFRGSATFALSGSHTGSGSPANAAACITWLITIGYRGGHPRSYVPGIAAVDTLTVATFTGTFASSLAAGAATFRTSTNGYSTSPFSSVTLGTLSFVRNKLWRTPPVFVPYSGAIVDARIDTQRRRLGPDVS
jgi:hypothetical protein